MSNHRLLNGVGVFVERYARRLVIIGILMTLFMGYQASKLSMKNQFSDMLPKGIPQVEEYDKIARNYPSASTVMITLEDSTKNLPRLRQAANELAGKLKSLVHGYPRPNQDLSLSLRWRIFSGDEPVPGVIYDSIPLVQRIDYRIDKEFFLDHGLMIQKTRDLESSLKMFHSLHLPELLVGMNDNFEREYVEDQEKMTELDGERQAVESLEGVRQLLRSLALLTQGGDSVATHEAIDAFISGEEYFLSPDNTMLILMLQPAVRMDDWDNMLILGEKINLKLNEYQAENPELTVGATGLPVLGYEEMETTLNDMGWSSLIALFLILILIVGSFGSWKYPLMAIVALVVAFIWTSGFIALSLKYLNMMSASFGLILIGLGIDFGIHVITGYNNNRNEGLGRAQSIRAMYLKSGNGIITGATTTAAVFFSLILAGFRAMSEMGIAIGSGILITLVLMLILLPALMLWSKNEKGAVVSSGDSRSLLRRIWHPLGRFLSFSYLERVGEWIIRPRNARLVLIVTALTLVLSVWGAAKLKFEYNYLETEPKEMPAVVTQNKILDKFEMAPDFILFTARDLDSCRSKVEQVKKDGKKTGLVSGLDAITEFLPSAQTQAANRLLLEQFRLILAAQSAPTPIIEADVETIISELERLHNNIVEIGELSISAKGETNKIVRKCDEIVGKKDEDSKVLQLIQKMRSTSSLTELLTRYQTILFPVMHTRLWRMSNPSPITLDSLPATILDRYMNVEDSTFLVLVYPRANVWDEIFLRQINARLSEISPKVTGYPIITLIFIDLIKEKGELAFILSFIAIIFLLLIDFRSWKYMLLALVPISVGALWMLGLMALAGLKFDYNNLLTLPLILGIGIDDGVHILHRYRLEGRLSFPVVIHHTGRAILLTSLTTAIGFGSMALATHRGLAGMGKLLTFGVGSCFLSSLLVLPAIITIYETYFHKGDSHA